ncbi:Uncharacterized protein TCM_006672, partial [Theobroma cacao]
DSWIIFGGFFLLENHPSGIHAEKSMIAFLIVQRFRQSNSLKTLKTLVQKREKRRFLKSKETIQKTESSKKKHKNHPQKFLNF